MESSRASLGLTWEVPCLFADVLAFAPILGEEQAKAALERSIVGDR